METDSFKNGLLFLKKIITALNKKDINKIEEITVLYFNASSLKNIELALEYNIVKNLINVSSIKTDSENVVDIDPRTWDSKKEYFYEKTRNCIVIEEKGELVLHETYSVLTKFSKYYPLVIFQTSEDINKTDISEKGYYSYVDKNFVCCYNKDIKSFYSYTVEDFENLKKENNIVKNIFRERGQGKEVPITIKKENKVSKNQDGQYSGINFKFLDGLKSPRYDKKLDKYNRPSSKQWIQEFYEYIKDLLSRLFPNDRLPLINKILNNETLKSVWIPCFTHEFANPNAGENYEAYETIGDAIQKYCFKFYIMEREPNVTEAKLTELDQIYMSKDFQSFLSKKMKLQEWLVEVSVDTLRMDISEDLVEALYGAIDTLLYSQRQTIGLGTIITYNLFCLLFDDYVFPGLVTSNKESKDSVTPTVEYETDTLADVTYVQQIFKSLKLEPNKKEGPYIPLEKPNIIPDKLWGKIVKDMNKTLLDNNLNPVIIRKDTPDHPGIIEDIKKLPDSSVMVEVKIMEKYVKELKKTGVKIEGKGDIIIGKSIKNTQKSAKKQAYSQAKQFLIKHGMTRKWRLVNKNNEQLANLQNEDLAFKKAKKKFPELVGNINVFRENAKKGKKSAVNIMTYQIRGVDENGRIIPIYTRSTQDPAFEQGIIDEFLEDRSF